MMTMHFEYCPIMGLKWYYVEEKIFKATRRRGMKKRNGEKVRELKNYHK